MVETLQLVTTSLRASQWMKKYHIYVIEEVNNIQIQPTRINQTIFISSTQCAGHICLFLSLSLSPEIDFP